MFLFLLEGKNLLIGSVPESIGLLFFGVGLVAITIFLRWFLNENDDKEVLKESNSRSK